MKREVLLLVFFFLIAGCLQEIVSQSRIPEVKISPRIADSTQTMDSLELATQERPYFLLIEQSEKALESGNYEAAALRLMEAMSVEPDNELNVALLSNLGMIYFYNDQDSMALVVLDKAIERSPRLLAPRQGRARILINNGRDREAYEEHEQILTIDSTNVESRFLHAMIGLNIGQLESAKEDIAVLESIAPFSRSTQLARATMYSLTGCEIEAISLFRKIIEKEPAPEYYSRMVACMLALDNLADASEAIGEWHEKYPQDGEVYYYRAILNKRRYLNEEAHRDAKHAIELGVPADKMLEALKK